MTAVSNTSPLILLEKTDHLWILEKLFTKVLIPPAVDREWLRPGGYVLPQWLSVTALSRQAASVAEGLHQKIDVGEAEAIALFSTAKADWLLLDDLKGRTQAASMGLPVIGTVGILIIAKKKGLIPAIQPVLNILKKHRFYLSDEVLAKALALTGEG
jgi:uncharacterized protein